MGDNVTTLELHGSFDDCQAIAKQALADPDLNARAHLTSANSINVARWLPQQFYYFYGLKQWSGEPAVISVPSGNFGNLASGILAHLSGLPVSRFLAACNANDVVPRFFQTERYEPRPSVATISNAMDVGDPSNFVRILEMFDDESRKLTSVIDAVSVSDQVTASTMTQVYAEYGYVLDPHGAVAYRALADYLQERPASRGIFLETAHPVKFDSVEKILGITPVVPESVSQLESRPKQAIEVRNDYSEVKELLLSKI
jgi:threonine synthase